MGIWEDIFVFRKTFWSLEKLLLLTILCSKQQLLTILCSTEYGQYQSTETSQLCVKCGTGVQTRAALTRQHGEYLVPSTYWCAIQV